MTPFGLDLSVLRALLAEYAIEIELTSDVGAGVALADTSLAQYDFAIAVIPADHGQRDASRSAIYVEIGVAVARGLPLLVITEPSIPPSPALVGATTIIITQLGNEEALRLHLGLFSRQVRAVPRAQHPARLSASPTPSVPAAYAVRLQAVRESTGGLRGAEFERFVGDLLREAGAQAEERSPWEPDGGIDIAAFIPGEEQRLGAVMIQVKSGTLTSHALRATQRELSAHVLQVGAGLGLLVYDQVTPDARKVPPALLVSSLGIDQLLAELETEPLSAVLTQARNRAVHGM
jgi:Restriction endonuclease